MMRSSGRHRRIRTIPLPTEEADLDAMVDSYASEVDWDAALPDEAYSWRWHFAQTSKRIMDVVFSGVGLILLLPFFVLVGLIIVIDSPGHVFYPWIVVGYRGRRFTGYKFRTMVMGADRMKDEFQHLNEMTGPVF